MAPEAAAAPGRTPRLVRVGVGVRVRVRVRVRVIGLGLGWLGLGLGLGLGQGLGLGSCMRTGTRNCLLGTPRRSRLGRSWPFTRRRGASMR
eukprot:scaffold137704_cov118-Phaeocystis_antarctica.AAC.1